MENCRQELDDIIRERRIRSVFQPIVSLRDGNIFGFEALSRITGQTGIFTRQTGRNGFGRDAGGGGKGASGRQSSRVSSAAMILQRFTENAAVKMSAGEL